MFCAAVLVSACATSTAPPPPSGAMTYATHCASCHGPRGAGDGPVAPALRGGAPDLRGLSRRNGGVFPAETVAGYIDGRNPPAAHGTRQMPVWGEVFDATMQLVVGAEGAQSRIARLIEHLRGLQYD